MQMTWRQRLTHPIILGLIGLIMFPVIVMVLLWLGWAPN
jgi:hypothetical protein